MIIMAFTGVKGSGKSTASSFLTEVNSDLREITLAKRLKDASSIALKIDRNSFDDPAVKEKELDTPVYLDDKKVKQIFDIFKLSPDFDTYIRPHIGVILHSPRRAAQYVGTEILRAYDEDIHCKGAVLDIEAGRSYVVTDLRFPGEYQFFKNRFGENFHPYYVQNIQAEKKIDNHPSERQVFEVAKLCPKLENNGTLEDFRIKVQNIYRSLTTSNNLGVSNG